ncbi:MAG: hypothetical protein COZ16_04320, partial [Flavobacteriaceae bacterium CG_4_10_14_3_um_filter_31_253]
MMNPKIIFLFLFLIFTIHATYAQRKLGGNVNRENITIGVDGRIDTLSNNGSTKVILSGKTNYTDYKIFSHKRDTAFIDTTLSIKKEYAFNYLRKDNFELLPFHNQGQTFNNL